MMSINGVNDSSLKAGKFTIKVKIILIYLAKTRTQLYKYLFTKFRNDLV